jgi:hypothetical protein
MEYLQRLFFMIVFCQSLACADDLIEDGVSDDDASTNYVFVQPDIVANYEKLGAKVILEAFGATEVNIFRLFS